MTSEDIYSKPSVQSKEGDGPVNQLSTAFDQLQVSGLGEHQDSNPQLVTMKKYLVWGELPLDKQKAKDLVLSKP